APVAGNTGAEVVLDPGGKYVWGSNRGANTIATFAVDASGQLSYKSGSSTTGMTPRHFSLADPAGNFMLVANQGSNNVVVLSVDHATGALAPTGTQINAAGPSFAAVVALPR